MGANVHKDFQPKTFQAKMWHVIEECGEVCEALGKIGRFGPYSSNPLIPEAQREVNIVWAKREIKDLQAALENFMVELEILDQAG